MTALEAGAAPDVGGTPEGRAAPESVPAVTRPRRRRSLILAGGGYKVAFQAGVLQVWLDEAGLEFDHADGASGGNLNLAMWCQGMSGTEIADRWRAVRPVRGMGFAWREWWKGPFAASLLTLDRFRRNVLPDWGLDWERIRATEREATFNVYDFTDHRLVPLPAAEMDAEMLMASISIPGWFPPVRARGHTWLDAVFLSDANLEEAIERGADELWIIWTVSERSQWFPGFIGIYFGLIETVANGNLRRVLRRIERSNEAIAEGRPGEFGRPIEVRILRAEVPIHYLIVASGDRVREGVERGVVAARRWCEQHGVPLGSAPRPPAADDTRLTFTEDMRGWVGLGETDPGRGASRGVAAGTPLMVHLDIAIDGVARFMSDPAREAAADGWIECEALGGRLLVSTGTFNLFHDAGDPIAKTMRYRLFASTPSGEPLTLSGVKHVRDEPGFDPWDDTSTLLVRVLRGHVALADEDATEVVAAGIIRVRVLDFLRQLTTFRVEAPTAAERAALLGRFGAFFLGRLWDVYARGILTEGPV